MSYSKKSIRLTLMHSTLKKSMLKALVQYTHLNECGNQDVQRTKSSPLASSAAVIKVCAHAHTIATIGEIPLMVLAPSIISGAQYSNALILVGAKTTETYIDDQSTIMGTCICIGRKQRI